MRYRVSFKPSAEKDLKRIPKPTYYRVILALENLQNNPFVGKKLKGELYGLYSLRVWPYRIIYQVYKRELIVIIIRIGHRQGVY